MRDKATLERAREGRQGALSAKHAIAIGLSTAGRPGVKRAASKKKRKT